MQPTAEVDDSTGDAHAAAWRGKPGYRRNDPYPLQRGNDMPKTTYIIKLSTEGGGLLSTDCITVQEDISLADLVKRCEFGTTPAAGGDIIAITRDEE